MSLTEHIADIRAIDQLEELVFSLRDRPAGSNAGLGCFYAPSGFGKTTAIQAVVARFNQGEILVAEGQEHWKSSPKAMLRSLLKSCDYVPAQSWSLDRLQDEVIQQLLAYEATLIIDEADMACSGANVKRLEILRNIHDALGYKARIILVGEEKLPMKISEIERVKNRVLSWVAVSPVDADDIAKLVEKIELNIDTSILMRLAEMQKYRIRTLVSTVQAIKDWASIQGIGEVKKEHWDEIPKNIAPKVRMELV